MNSATPLLCGPPEEHPPGGHASWVRTLSTNQFLTFVVWPSVWVLSVWLQTLRGTVLPRSAVYPHGPAQGYNLTFAFQSLYAVGCFWTGVHLPTFTEFFTIFRLFFGIFQNFFLSDGSAVCLVPLQVPVLRLEPLRCCPATRPNKDNEKTEVCAGSDMFQLYAIDTYLSDTCQHPVGTRLVVPVLVCFGSPFVFFRCR